jgi:hypothetical protein
MKHCALIASGTAIALAASALAASCPNPLQTLDLRQRGYAQIKAEVFAARPWLYLYVPDIKTVGGVKAIDMWLVEGVYGPAFPRGTGTMDEPEFQKMRRSANVRALPIKVEFDEKAQSGARPSRAVTIGKDTVKIQVDRVETYLWRDTVTISICR